MGPEFDCRPADCPVASLLTELPPFFLEQFVMTDFLRALRRRPAEHREVFAEFAILLVFAVAEQMAAQRERLRMRIVR